MNCKTAIISLGCAKNRVNSEQMMFLLREAGYHVSGDTDGADAVVVNTCGFIESAKTEAIETILELAGEKAAGNIGKLIVVGCLPQRYKDSILREMPEIDAIVGTGSFDDIVDAVKNTLSQSRSVAQVCAQPKPRYEAFDTSAKGGPTAAAHIPVHSAFADINAPVSETGRIISTSHVWAYLKIAEGCDNRCAYCCIPSIRGRLRSRHMEHIVAEAKGLADRGYKELILVAQDTTAYGLDLYGKRSLTALLRELGSIEKLPWIRLLYLYPDGFDNALIDEIEKNDRIVKYLDIPIQHINDNILRSMNRRSTATDIRKLFYRLKEGIPNIVLRTSLITGLPGEGDEEFDELCCFLREMKIQRAGVFAYSPEEGTPAALMPRTSKKLAKSRAKIIQELQSQVMAEYSRSRIGTREEVLVEGFDDSGVLLARSYAEAPEIDGYIRVANADVKLDHSGFLSVKLTNTSEGDMVGHPVGEVL